MHNHGHARKSPLQTSLVAHISNEVAQAGMIQSGSAHVVLLQFIAAENHKLFRLVIPEHDLDKLLPKGSRPACDQNYLLRPVHPIRLAQIPLKSVSWLDLSRCREV